MRNRGLIAVFCICYFVVNFNISFIYPMLPSLQQHFAANEHHIALLLGAFPFIAFICNLLYGPFIDKYGKKKFILIGAAGSVLSYAGSIFSPNIESLIAFRILSGFFVPMMGATIFPLIVELFEDERRLFVTGIVQGAASLAQLLALFGLSVFVVFGMYAYWLTKNGTGDSYQLAILFMFSGLTGLIASTTITRISKLFARPGNAMVLILLVAIVSVLFMPLFADYIILQTLLFSLFSWVRSSINPLIFVEVYKMADINERGTLNGVMNA